jgi:hypothetical protein
MSRKSKERAELQKIRQGVEGTGPAHHYLIGKMHNLLERVKRDSGWRFRIPPGEPQDKTKTAKYKTVAR